MSNGEFVIRSFKTEIFMNGIKIFYKHLGRYVVDTINTNLAVKTFLFADVDTCISLLESILIVESIVWD